MAVGAGGRSSTVVALPAPPPSLPRVFAPGLTFALHLVGGLIGPAYTMDDKAGRIYRVLRREKQVGLGDDQAFEVLSARQALQELSARNGELVGLLAAEAKRVQEAFGGRLVEELKQVGFVGTYTYCSIKSWK